uniref:Uncharacterized protein n=1 Tax=Anguilla anguilla TaxID=7936 RepID=A0A0E9U0C9_ANGAN
MQQICLQFSLQDGTVTLWLLD